MFKDLTKNKQAMIVLAAVIIIAFMPIILFGQVDTISAPKPIQEFWKLTKENWIATLFAVYEIAVRYARTERSISVLGFIGLVLNVLIPDRKKLSEEEKQITKDDIKNYGLKNWLKKWTHY